MERCLPTRSQDPRSESDKPGAPSSAADRAVAGGRALVPCRRSAGTARLPRSRPAGDIGRWIRWMWLRHGEHLFYQSIGCPPRRVNSNRFLAGLRRSTPRRRPPRPCCAAADRAEPKRPFSSLKSRHSRTPCLAIKKLPGKKDPAEAGPEYQMPVKVVSHPASFRYRRRAVATQSLPLSGAPGQKIGPSATNVPLTPGETAVNFSVSAVPSGL